MKKLIALILIIFSLCLVACERATVTDKKVEVRNVCTHYRSEYNHTLWIGGSNGLSLIPNSGAFPVAQYRSICDAYGDKDFYMIEVSDKYWNDVSKEKYDTFQIGNEV